MRFDLILDDLDLLCAELHCSPDTVLKILNYPESYFKRHVVSRRRTSSRPREVIAFIDPWRRIQRRIALSLEHAVSLQSTSVTAFRKGSSAFENAKLHCNKPAVVVADLEEFFNSITIQDVYDQFLSLSAHRLVAATLAMLVTVDGRLPQGGRASPSLANLIGERLDRIVLLQKQAGCQYTRYVDDLAFSGPASTLPTERQLARWINEAGFCLRQGSYAIRRTNAGPYVTGFFVGGTNPKVPRAVRRRIERFLYFAQRFDAASAAQKTFRGARAFAPRALDYVEGMANWLRRIDPDLAEDWSKQVAALR